MAARGLRDPPRQARHISSERRARIRNDAITALSTRPVLRTRRTRPSYSLRGPVTGWGERRQTNSIILGSITPLWRVRARPGRRLASFATPMRPDACYPENYSPPRAPHTGAAPKLPPTHPGARHTPSSYPGPSHLATRLQHCKRICLAKTTQRCTLYLTSIKALLYSVRLSKDKKSRDNPKCTWNILLNYWES